MTISTQREEIIAASGRAVTAFIRAFDRAPTKRELEIIVSAIIRHFDAPDAPTQTLQ
jgi:hypothetical protein